MSRGCVCVARLLCVRLQQRLQLHRWAVGQGCAAAAPAGQSGAQRPPGAGAGRAARVVELAAFQAPVGGGLSWGGALAGARAGRHRRGALHLSAAAEGGDGVPATFVAPEKVDLSQFPPPTRAVTKDDIEVQFVRSSGAGGQNVNKVNTKADIRFNVSRADFLPQWVKSRLVEEKNRMNSEGELVISAQRHRTQKQNYEDAMEKLQEMIDAAAQPPTGPSDDTIKRMKSLARKANDRRLDDKKRESAKRKERSRKDWD